MDTIDNRYKIIRELYQGEKNINTFVVVDFHNDNKILSLSIIDPEKLKNISKDFISSHFIQIAKMPNDRFFEEYEFSSAVVDFEDMTKKVYYYTHELHEEYYSLTDYIDPLDIEKVLKAIVQICQCQNLAIMNGFLHAIDSIDDFYVYDNDGEFEIKATDLVTLSLNLNDTLQDYQFENIANLFLSLLDGYTETKNVYENIQIIKEVYQYQFFNENQAKILDTILTIASDIRSGNYGSIIYDFYYRLIASINEKLGTDFSAETGNIYSYLCKYPKIPSREKSLKTILNKISGSEIENNQFVFMLTGNLGLGKSRFLNDLIFQLNFENVDYYHVEIADSPYVFFLQLFSDILDHYPMLNSGIELNNFYIQIKECCLEANTHYDERYILMKKMTSIIHKAGVIKRQVIIIDNFHFVDKFTLEFILSAINNRPANSNVYFVFSFSKDFASSGSYFKSCYETLSKQNYCYELGLKVLTDFEVAIVMKSVLLMRNEPVITAKEINKIAGGNPVFIIEMIFKLVEEEKLIKNRKDGYWEMHEEIFTLSHFIDIPESMMSLARVTFKKYFQERYDIFKRISIFHLLLKKDFIGKVLPELSENEVNEIFDDFLYNSFISEVEDGIYRIDEKILQSVLYYELTKQEKQDLHAKALEILQQENNKLFIDELLIHYSYFDLQEEVLNIVLESARDQVNKGIFREAIVNYERAMFIIKNKDVHLKVKVGAELALAYCKIGLVSSALDWFEQLSESLEEISDSRILFDYYLNYCLVLYDAAEINTFMKSANSLNAVYKTLKEPTTLDSLMVKKIHLFKTMLKGDFKTSIGICNELIEVAKEKEISALALTDLYRILGGVHLYTSEYIKACEYYRLSYDIAEKKNIVLDKLRALNNLANIYLTRDLNFVESEVIYKKILDETLESGFEKMALLACVNLTYLYLQTGVLTKAEYYLSKVLEKLVAINSSLTNISSYAFLLNYELLLRKGSFVKAETYRKTLIEFFETNDNNSLLGDDITRFYDNSAIFDLAFGDYDASIENLKLAKNKSLDHEVKSIIQFKIDFIELLRGGNKSEAHLISDFSFLLKNLDMSNKWSLFSSSAFLLTISIALRKFDLVKNLADIFLAKVGTLFDNTIFVKAEILLIKAMFNEDEAEKLLNEALVIVKDQPILILEIIIYIQLALNYFRQEKVGFGILTFISAENKIIEFMMQVPMPKRLDFFNLYAFKVPFQITYDFIKTGKTKIAESVFSEKVSEVGLKRLLNSKDIKFLTQNRDFLEILLCEVFDVNDWVLKYRTLKETVENFRANYEYNIQILLNLMMQRLLAVYSNIIVYEEDSPPHFIFASDSKHISYVDISNALETGGVANLKNFAEHRNMELILLPLMDDATYMAAKKYSLLFLIQNQVALIGKKRISYCTDFSSFLFSLLEAHRLNSSVYRDPVSNAVTAKHFEKFLASTIDYSGKQPAPISVCYFYIENINAITEFFGEDVRTETINNVIEIVHSSIQSSDLVGRYAQDEFAILFYGATKNIVLRKLELILEKVTNFITDELDLPVALCFGMATLNEENVTFSNIIEKARIAMLHSKSLGVNRIAQYNIAYENQDINKNTIMSHYFKSIDYDAHKLSALPHFISISSGYASKSAMFSAFLQKILDLMDVDSVSLVQFIKEETTEARKLEKKHIVYSVSVDSSKPIELNTHYIRQASENMQTLIFDDLQLYHQENLTFPIWQSVLVCPIGNSSDAKGAIYIIANYDHSQFTNSDLSFINLLVALLEKEL